LPSRSIALSWCLTRRCRTISQIDGFKERVHVTMILWGQNGVCRWTSLDGGVIGIRSLIAGIANRIIAERSRSCDLGRRWRRRSSNSCGIIDSFEKSRVNLGWRCWTLLRRCSWSRRGWNQQLYSGSHLGSCLACLCRVTVTLPLALGLFQPSRS
jgi:hypothetical protein